MDVPDPELITLSLTLLRDLNALDDEENLTPLGFHLARLPINPRMGKMMLMGAIFSCLDPVLNIAACLDFKDPFQVPMGKEKLVDEKKRDMSRGELSDHLVLHFALDGFENAKNPSNYCWDNFLNQFTMKLLQNMKHQFMDYLFEMEFVPDRDPKTPKCNQNSANTSLVKAIICAGLYPNLIFSKRAGRNRVSYKTLNFETVYFHPKSILNQAHVPPNSMLAYHVRLKSTSDYIHDGTLVFPLPVIFFGSKLEADANSVSVGKKLVFKCTESTGETILNLRNRLYWFLEYKVSHPGVVDWDNPDDSRILW